VFGSQFTSFEELKNHYQTDPYFSHVLTVLKELENVEPLPCKLHDGYLFERNLPCIVEGSLNEQVIKELHGSGLKQPLF